MLGKRETSAFAAAMLRKAEMLVQREINEPAKTTEGCTAPQSTPGTPPTATPPGLSHAA